MSRRSTKQRRAARVRAAIYRSIERERRARETFRRAFRHLYRIAGSTRFPAKASA